MAALLQAAHGQLQLYFEYTPNERTTKLHVQTQTPPLRVIRAFRQDDGLTLVHLHNLSGGVLGGDQLSLTAHVGPGAQAQITSTGATRVYRHRVGMPVATQVTTLQVAPQGLLEYLPDPLIPFAGSQYAQKSRIELAQDAGLFYWEIVTPGRTASGEIFDYECLDISLQITMEGAPLAREQFRLEPTRRPLTSPLRLGHYRYFATLYVCRIGAGEATWSALESQLDLLAQRLSVPTQTMWGVSTLPAHGLIVRGLAVNGQPLSAGLCDFWRVAKQTLYQRAAVLPRKVY